MAYCTALDRWRPRQRRQGDRAGPRWRAVASQALSLTRPDRAWSWRSPAANFSTLSKAAAPPVRARDSPNGIWPGGPRFAGPCWARPGDGGL